jgi:hypothetical protein
MEYVLAAIAAAHTLFYLLAGSNANKWCNRARKKVYMQTCLSHCNTRAYLLVNAYVKLIVGPPTREGIRPTILTKESSPKKLC